MINPQVPMSWGELLDRVSILEIKCIRLRSPAARANVEHELTALRPILAPITSALDGLRREMFAVNERLWLIEDGLRDHEASGDFGAAFVALARAVYRENAARDRLKQAVNAQLQSGHGEEKQYGTADRDDA